jgi:WD40 repeat protein
MNRPDFVARDNELAEIHKRLGGDGSRRTAIFHGLGGIGKTQLAVAYAKRHKDSYWAIFWLNIKDEDSLKQSLAKVARQILREYPSARCLSSVNMEILDDVIDAVKAAIGDIWSVCLQTLEGHNGRITSVAFSHDSTRLASSSYDRTIKIWDASSGACLQTLEGHNDPVTSVAFSHNSSRLASSSYNRIVKIWDASSGACMHMLEGHSRPVASVAFSHDSTRLASSSYDRTIKIWDASSGACL